jgi:hypothetical protein
MKSLTIKLSEPFRQKVKSTARITDRLVSLVVRDAICSSLPPVPGVLSLLERTRDLCGKGESAIPDPTTNDKHMKAYGA